MHDADLVCGICRFEGFGSTLGGFARSPQIARALPPLLRQDSWQENLLIPENQQTDSGFVESLQSPLLTSEAQQSADEERNQSFRPSSLLARSLGTFNEVFSRQVRQHAGSRGTSISAHTFLQTQRTEDEWPHSGPEGVDVALGGSPPAGCLLTGAVSAAFPCALRHNKIKCCQFAGLHGGDLPNPANDKGLPDDVVIGPMPNTHTPATADKQTRAAQIQAAFLCGVINAIITIPVMTSFAAIIFQARTYADNLDISTLSHLLPP